MQELKHSNPKGIIIGTSNLTKLIDDALWRRFDLALERKAEPKGVNGLRPSRRDRERRPSGGRGLGEGRESAELRGRRHNRARGSAEKNVP
jgi:hypothetical protein